MGIWIRSQNNKILLNAIFFGIYGTTKIYAGNTIEGEGATGHFVVGEYESEEEAIAVLNVIHNTLTDCVEFGYTSTTRANSEKSMVVYSMPVKGFLKEKAQA